MADEEEAKAEAPADQRGIAESVLAFGSAIEQQHERGISQQQQRKKAKRLKGKRARSAKTHSHREPRRPANSFQCGGYAQDDGKAGAQCLRARSRVVPRAAHECAIALPASGRLRGSRTRTRYAKRSR